MFTVVVSSCSIETLSIYEAFLGFIQPFFVKVYLLNISIAISALFQLLLTGSIFLYLSLSIFLYHLISKELLVLLDQVILSILPISVFWLESLIHVHLWSQGAVNGQKADIQCLKDTVLNVHSVSHRLHAGCSSDVLTAACCGAGSGSCLNWNWLKLAAIYSPNFPLKVTNFQ